MIARQAAEETFVRELPRIERIIAALCRRHGLQGDDADDFASWVKLRLIEDDYAILRKFRGESAIGTYLTVVIAMLFRDHRVQHWGRWRPSAEARRRGTLAMRLELLVYRDGLTFVQAAQQLRAEGTTDLGDRALRALLASLPVREPLRPRAVDAGAIDTLPDESRADAAVLHDDAVRHRESAEAAIGRALEELPVEDRLIVRMRFWDGLSLADVARALGLPQKPLYRRLESLLGRLRVRLVECGLTAAEVRDLLDEREAGVGPEFGAIGENASTRPSNEQTPHSTTPS